MEGPVLYLKKSKAEEVKFPPIPRAAKPPLIAPPKKPIRKRGPVNKREHIKQLEADCQEKYNRFKTKWEALYSEAYNYVSAL